MGITDRRNFKWPPVDINLTLILSTVLLSILTCSQRPSAGQHEAEISIPLQGADIDEALATAAPEMGIGVVTCGLPVARPTGEIRAKTLETAVEQLRKLCGIQATLYRGVLLASGLDQNDDVAACLRGSSSSEEARLLFRGPDSGHASEPGYETVLDAIGILYRRQQDNASRQRLLKAAYWMAGPELHDILSMLKAVNSGQVTLRYGSLAPSERSLDPCAGHWNILGETAPHDNSNGSVSESFHDVGYDPFERSLREEKGTISLSEYKSRLLAAARKSQGVFGRDERFLVPVDVTNEGLSVGQVIDNVHDSSGLPLTYDKAIGSLSVRIVSKNTPRGDVLAALALVTKSVWVRDPVGNAYRLTNPETLAEKLTCSLPLSLRSLCVLTPTEKALADQQVLEDMWKSLEASQIQGLRGNSSAFPALPPSMRSHLVRLTEIRFARRFARWLQRFPEREGAVPMWLFERNAGFAPLFVLVTPGSSETLAGLSYIQKKLELEGKNAILLEFNPSESRQKEGR